MFDFSLCKIGRINNISFEQINIFKDTRGWLCEMYRNDEMNADTLPMMSYVSLTYPDIMRGPHEHIYQTDTFILLGMSTMRIYLWDNRTDSDTFMNRSEIDCEEGRIYRLIVPPKVIHGYKNIGSKDSLIINFPNKLFAGEMKKEEIDEVRYEKFYLSK
jgi:dTDP-4-dehydrorhamnose 3,5-epimerase